MDGYNFTGNSDLPVIPKGIDDLIKQLPKNEYEQNVDASEQIDEVNIDGSTFPYTCEFCGRGFHSQKKYQEHIATHSARIEEKHAVCKYCNQSFASKEELKNHTCKPREMDQFNTEPRHNSIGGGYVCQVCGKSFNQRYHLQTHMASHTGNKPYSCMICGKAFARKDVLGVHMKVHSDVKEFQCEVCGARFKQRYHLTRHMNTHLERVDVVCDFCGQVFHRLDRYNQHIKRVHITKDSQM